MDRGVVTLLGRTVGLLGCLWPKVVSTATFPLFLAENDGLVAVLIVCVCNVVSFGAVSVPNCLFYRFNWAGYMNVLIC